MERVEKDTERASKRPKLVAETEVLDLTGDWAVGHEFAWMTDNGS